MAKLSIENINCKDKIVLVRCDFNVPLDEDLDITDDRRVLSSLKTIQKVLSDGGSAVLCSHLGRPQGQIVDELSLRPVAKRLSELLRQRVQLAPDCVGEEVNSLKNDLLPGQAILLENLRFHDEETKNYDGFAKKLASGCDLYVNDAFGCMHRNHLSICGMGHCEMAYGYLVQKELEV